MKGADEIIRRKIIGKDERNAQKGGDFCRGPNLQGRGNGKVVLEERDISEFQEAQGDKREGCVHCLQWEQGYDTGEKAVSLEFKKRLTAPGKQCV